MEIEAVIVTSPKYPAVEVCRVDFLTTGREVQLSQGVAGTSNFDPEAKHDVVSMSAFQAISVAKQILTLLGE